MTNLSPPKNKTVFVRIAIEKENILLAHMPHPRDPILPGRKGDGKELVPSGSFGSYGASSYRKRLYGNYYRLEKVLLPMDGMGPIPHIQSLLQYERKGSIYYNDIFTLFCPRKLILQPYQGKQLQGELKPQEREGKRKYNWSSNWMRLA